MGSANVKSAAVNEDEIAGLHLEGRNGNVRKLPDSLYDNLSSMSDPYSRTKDFIGYVDPAHGVVLVESDKLLEEYNSYKQTPKEKEQPELPGLINTTSTGFLNDLNGILLDGNRDAVSKTPKTMHQLAYERITGSTVPLDDTRPISGFSIKKGQLVVNSTTFNAYEDEFHTSEREMSSFELKKLSKLMAKLHQEEVEKNSEKSILFN